MSDWVIFIDKKFNDDDESLHGCYFTGYKDGLPLFDKEYTNAVKLIGEEIEGDNLYSVIMDLYNNFGIKGIPIHVSKLKSTNDSWFDRFLGI